MIQEDKKKNLNFVFNHFNGNILSQRCKLK